MKVFTGWILSAGLAMAATSAQAQVGAPEVVVSSPYVAASDINGPYVGGPYAGGPYAAMPPEARVPVYGVPDGGPRLLPAREVYTVVREGGFSPLGIPRQRGFFYTIAVINRGGDDGRLLIDARDGRIVRFVPAYRIGGNFDREMSVAYGPGGPLPPMNQTRGVPRPPANVPHVASRTPSSVPLPRPMPHQRAGEPKPLAAKPAPAPVQQSAAIQAKPSEASSAPPAAAPVEAKPAAPQILPTQEMPKVQGLE